VPAPPFAHRKNLKFADIDQRLSVPPRPCPSSAKPTPRDEAIAGYLEKLGAPADPPTPPTPAQAPTLLPRSSAQDDEPAQVAALRSELPPPVQPGTGQKTHGRWLGAGTSGEAVALISGNDGQAEEAARYLKEIGITRPLAIVAHVETKANR
jgi:hypothetical protein